MKVRLQEQIRQGVVADKMFKNVQNNLARVSRREPKTEQKAGLCRAPHRDRHSSPAIGHTNK